MKWCEFHVTVKKDQSDFLKNFFTAHKISSYAEYIPRGGRNAEIRAYIQASRRRELEKSLAEALDLLPRFFPGTKKPELQVFYREEKEFEEAWKKHFHPLEVGRFLIVPAWEKTSETEGKRIISIDPGMAFGTGQHFTTRYCIERMQEHIEGGFEVLDAGCGSGILSIAAALLGAGRVVGIDIEREAVKASERNFRLNCPGKKAEFKKMKLERMAEDAGFHVILANMTDHVLCRNAGVLKRLLSEKGALIVSGIRCSRIKNVRESFADMECADEASDEKGEWAGLTFIR